MIRFSNTSETHKNSNCFFRHRNMYSLYQKTGFFQGNSILRYYILYLYLEVWGGVVVKALRY